MHTQKIDAQQNLWPWFDLLVAMESPYNLAIDDLRVI